MWPTRPGETVGAVRAVVLIALGTALMALSAKVSLPLPYVPMTLQTLVVLMIGAAYGWRLGSATMIAYLPKARLARRYLPGRWVALHRCSARPRDIFSVSLRPHS